MATSDPFLGVRLKLSRARDQIHNLQDDFTSFLATRPCGASLHFQEDIKELTFTVRVTAQLDAMFGVRIGEITHNLRSAMDHLVWELVILTTGRPPALPSKNQFAIFKSKDGFKTRGIDQQLQCVRQDAVDLIESEQPFSTGEGIKSPLWHLQELSNADKHRTLHLTGALVQKFEIPNLRINHDGTMDVLEVRHQGPIQDKAILWRARFPNAKSFPVYTNNGKIETNLTIGIAFDEATPAVGGWLTIATLANIHGRSDKIARRIATEIFERDLGLVYEPYTPRT